jgi:hypothetical protein
MNLPRFAGTRLCRLQSRLTRTQLPVRLVTGHWSLGIDDLWGPRRGAWTWFGPLLVELLSAGAFHATPDTRHAATTRAV